MNNPKLYDFENAVRKRQELRKAGKRVVLTNGCFDLLHPGHLCLLQEAAKMGDSLWVALNSDKSVQSLKGTTRPIMNEEMRAFALGALSCVDGIYIFNGKRVTEEIRAFQPDLYVRAADRTVADLDSDELRALREVGAEIHFVPFLKGFSTTRLIERIRNAQLD